METIYYSLDAKRLTVCGEAAGRRASGGQETVCYAFVPRPRRPVMPAGGKVVDFTAYRQAAHPEEYAPREDNWFSDKLEISRVISSAPNFVSRATTESSSM